ncbi:AMP-binding protein [Lutimonas zeaxanthinifaciens]|uniref:AMP-binding protein n=1 Tax=Lutimonas zeaxanthinifaciens TaxID=3060215 RepID=UPI00265D5882|nr:AMP-binding protein [Lutimonas sp. YSD2104]WKK67193.1 AMP-binding protein [Lutimonas sp. YSD2104]
MMKTSLLHPEFKWNDRSFFNKDDLIDFVDVKYPELTDFFTQWFSESGWIRVKTSGSTGVPKEISLKRKHMINSAMATASFFELEAGAKVLHCLPLGYIAGRMMLVRAMIMGWEMDLVEASGTPEIRDKSYDFSAMVPLQVQNSIDKLGNVRALIVGGGSVSDKLKERITDLKTEIYATYGMTETVTHVALAPLNKASGLEGSRTVFKALPNISFSRDSRTCLVINAPSICSEEVVTNDIVKLISSTSFQWIARHDHVINSGGIKLMPELIEKKLYNLIHVPFFLGPEKDEVLGEQMVLFVESSQKYDLLSELKTYHVENPRILLKFEIPRKVYFLNSFIYTETGKIQREQTMKKVLN